MALETIGSICAVGQLVGQCGYVLGIVEKARRSTETLKEFQAQLQCLRVLSEKIEQNPSLQTTEIISHTKSILDIVNQHDYLTVLLEKRRLYRVWAFFRVERRLLEHTKTIEILKSTLAISIQDQQSRVLDKIDQRTQMTAKMPRVTQEDEDEDVSEGGAYLDGGQGSREQFSGWERTLTARSGVDHPPERRARDSTSQDSTVVPMQVQFSVGSEQSVWVGNEARSGAGQLNGNTIRGATNGVAVQARAQVWVDNLTHGRGDQRNGFDLVGSAATVQGGTWWRNIHTGAQNGRSAGTQRNGHLCRAEKEHSKHGRARRS